ncbi:MAG TPA: hypothetical protein VKA32_07265 [Gammaproteobacteria bacterium]|nr:hypothetical protein [Gammaproteobacteria bacterium]
MNSSRRNFISGVLGSSALALVAPLSSPIARAGTTEGPDEDSRIRFVGTGFDPMVAHVETGSSLPFANHGSLPLDLVAAPDAPAAVRAHVAPGTRGSVTFEKPGIYLLYDKRTTRLDSKVGQVVAQKASDAFPRPAYAIVLATDRQGYGPQPGDGQIVIPEATMTFQPWALVVNSGQPIHFRNDDGDPHIAMPSPEPMLMPMNTGGSADSTASGKPWLQAMNAFAPVNLPPSGGTGVVTLRQPGIHHYFCPIHAAYDSEADTFAPLRSYGGFPFVMDGIVVVLPA